MIIFREMKESDIDAVYEMCVLLAIEDKEDYIEENIYNTIVSTFEQEILKAWVAVENEKVIGGIGFYVMPRLLNYNIIQANEAFWYVYPEYRKGTGSQLLAVAEHKLNVDNIEFGLKDSRLLALMQKKGYKYSLALPSYA